MLPSTGIATFSLRTPQFLNAYKTPAQVTAALATYKKAIKDYEKAIGKQDAFFDDHVNKYNYYPLAIYEAFVKASKGKDATTKQQYLAHITDAINTLFIDDLFKVIHSTYSTEAVSFGLMTRADIITEAEQALGLTPADEFVDPKRAPVATPPVASGEPAKGDIAGAGDRLLAENQATPTVS